MSTNQVVQVRVDCREEELFLDVEKDQMLQSYVFKQLLTVSEVAGIRLISISDTSLDDVFDLWYGIHVLTRELHTIILTTILSGYAQVSKKIKATTKIRAP